MTDDQPRTTVTADGETAIPSEYRAELGVEPGDSLKWDITDDGRMLVDHVPADTDE